MRLLLPILRKFQREWERIFITVRIQDRRLTSHPFRVLSRDAFGFLVEYKSSALSSMKSIYLQYKDETANDVCVSVESFADFPTTVSCPANRHHALVYLTVSDPSLSVEGDDATLSPCCHADDDLNPKVKYAFLIPCQSTCPEGGSEFTSVRRLRWPLCLVVLQGHGEG